MKRPISLVLLAAPAAPAASAATTCTYLVSGSSMQLQDDCITDAPIIIPNGMTHAGAGHKITAVDPPSDHFRGAVIQNGGASANNLSGNDVGVWLIQETERGDAPVLPTQIKVIDNVITNEALTNGAGYQAGITAHGNGDTIRGNRISGAGYDPATRPGSTFGIDDYRFNPARGSGFSHGEISP